MLAVKAVSNYAARAADEIDVKEGQILYVLSVTEDERKYYLSSSSRVPFSRHARSGYAPVPLFAVVGDTLPPGSRAKVRMMISDSRAPMSSAAGRKSGNPEAAAAPPRDASGSSQVDAGRRRLVGGVRGGAGAAPPSFPGREPPLSRNISAAARRWFGGIMGRPSRAWGAAPAGEGRRSPPRAAEGAPPADGQGRRAPLANAQIVTYAKRRTGIVYRIKFTMADGAELSVRRTYEDIRRLDDRIRPRFAKMPPFPAPPPPPPWAGRAGDAAAAARGKELNVYLQGVVAVHRQLVSPGGGDGLGLHEVIWGVLGSPAGSHDRADSPAAGVRLYLPRGRAAAASPGSKRRRSSADSLHFASRPLSRNGSVRGEASPAEGRASEARQRYGVAIPDSGKQSAAAPAAAAMAPDGPPEDPAAGGHAAAMVDAPLGARG